MSRVIVIGGGALGFALAVVAWRINYSSCSQETPFTSTIRPPEAAPLCPWREPESDLKRFFPNATQYEVETRILSGLRLELSERLGRAPTGDENALRVYAVYQEQTPLGAVLTRRVKGQFGAIELVLAVGTDRRVCGLRLQRLREPAAVVAAIQDARWLGSFAGKSADDAWKLGRDLPDVSAPARSSGQAIVDGVRSLLVLSAASSETSLRQSAATLHH